MNILITGAAAPLAQHIVTALAQQGHHQRLLDDCPQPKKIDPKHTGPKQIDWLQGSLTDPNTAWQAVRGIDALIHTGAPPPDLPVDPRQRDEVLLDLATRGTHVLLSAAVEAGVRRILYASTLEVFAAYPDTTYITELHQPLPTPATEQIIPYLGEMTCREFARDHALSVTALRLGRLTSPEEAAGQPRDLLWLDPRDAAQAFCAALQRDTSDQLNWVSRWAVYHICAPAPNPKFLLDRALAMGYQPRCDFT